MSSSVKQENRYRKMLIQRGNDQNDLQRQLEILRLRNIRPPRIPVAHAAAHTAAATRQQVRSWMRRHASEFETATELAESANAALPLPVEAIDDDTHWVWDEAINAFAT